MDDLTQKAIQRYRSSDAAFAERSDADLFEEIGGTTSFAIAKLQIAAVELWNATFGPVLESAVGRLSRILK